MHRYCGYKEHLWLWSELCVSGACKIFCFMPFPDLFKNASFGWAMAMTQLSLLNCSVSNSTLRYSSQAMQMVASENESSVQHLFQLAAGSYEMQLPPQANVAYVVDVLKQQIPFTNLSCVCEQR